MTILLHIAVGSIGGEAAHSLLTCTIPPLSALPPAWVGSAGAPRAALTPQVGEPRGDLVALWPPEILEGLRLGLTPPAFGLRWLNGVPNGEGILAAPDETPQRGRTPSTSCSHVNGLPGV